MKQVIELIILDLMEHHDTQRGRLIIADSNPSHGVS